LLLGGKKKSRSQDLAWVLDFKEKGEKKGKNDASGEKKKKGEQLRLPSLQTPCGYARNGGGEKKRGKGRGRFAAGGKEIAGKDSSLRAKEKRAGGTSKLNLIGKEVGGF